MKTDIIQSIIDNAKKCPSEEWEYHDPHDGCCGSPCTPDGCRESHPTGTFTLYGPKQEDYMARFQNEHDILNIVQTQPKHIIPLLESWLIMRRVIIQALWDHHEGNGSFNQMLEAAKEASDEALDSFHL